MDVCVSPPVSSSVVLFGVHLFVSGVFTRLVSSFKGRSLVRPLLIFPVFVSLQCDLWCFSHDLVVLPHLQRT